MQTIYLDLDIKKAQMPKIFTKQGAIGWKFKIILTESGVPFHVPTGAAFSLWYSGTAGAEGCYSAIDGKSAFTPEGNAVTVELAPEMLWSGGGGTMTVYLHTAQGEQVGFWNILYDVETTMPMDSAQALQYYVAFSEATRQTMDAVSRAEEAAASLGVPIPVSNGGTGAVTAQAARENLGAAPAGYGLGSQEAKIISGEALSNHRASGWYRYTDTVTDNPLGGYGGNMLVIASDLHIIQIAYIYATNDDIHHGCVAKRIITPNVNVDEWEWENPPMSLGKEYRTTERHNGLPVYVKLVDLGAISASAGVTHVSADLSASSNISFTSFEVTISDGTFCHRIENTPGTDISAYLWTNAVRWYVNVITTAGHDYSAFRGRAMLKYVYQ